MESPDMKFIIGSREFLCQLKDNQEALLAVKMIDNGTVAKMTKEEMITFKTSIVRWRDMQPQEPIDLISDDEENVAQIASVESSHELRYAHLLRRKSCDRMVVAESSVDDILTLGPAIEESPTPESPTPESPSSNSVNDVSLHSLIDLKHSRPVQKRKSEDVLKPVRRASMHESLPTTSSKPMARRQPVGLEEKKSKRKLECGGESAARRLFAKPHPIRKLPKPSSSKAHRTSSLRLESSSVKRALQARSVEKRREFSESKRFKSSGSSSKARATSKERRPASSSARNDANGKRNEELTEGQLQSARSFIRSAVDLLQRDLSFENRELLTLKLFEWARDGRNIINDLRERLSDEHSPRYSRERSLSRSKEAPDQHQFAVPDPVDRLQTPSDRSRKKPVDTSDERMLRSQIPSSSGSQHSASIRPTSDAVAVSAAAPASPAKSSKRNDDKRIYYANEKYRHEKCVLCGVSNRHSMVSHYVTKHPKDEVFISRLSPAFAKHATSTPLKPAFNEKMEISATCYFCESEKNLRPSSWAAHILTHTGERDYYCDEHGPVSLNHKCTGKKKVFEYDFVDDLLSGFMCKECNYVQVQEKNLIKHIKTTHKHRLGYFDRFYQEIHFVSRQMCPPLSAAAVKEEASCEAETGTSEEPDKALDANEPDPLDQPDESGSTSEYSFASPPVHIEMAINPYDIKMEEIEEDAKIRIVNNLNESNESMNQSAYAALLDRSILSEPPTTDVSEELNRPIVQETMSFDREKPSIATQREKPTTPILRDEPTMPITQDSPATPLSRKQPAKPISRPLLFTPNRLIMQTPPATPIMIKLKKSTKESIAFMSESEKIKYHSWAAFFNEPNGSSKVFLARPWLDSTKLLPVLSIRTQSHRVRLAALYKCMAENCCFSTNDSINMENHLYEHKRLLQVLSEFEKIDFERVSTSARIHSCVFGWRHCSYCEAMEDDPEVLVQHIKGAHGQSPFQCSQCFFRTADLGLFRYHFDEFHKDTTSGRLILLCDAGQPSFEAVLGEIAENRSKFISHYKCAQGCSEADFLYIERFRQHWETKHKASNDVKCSECGITLSLSTFERHMSCHGIRTGNCLHCLHCPVTASDAAPMLSHIHFAHPGKSAFSFVRNVASPIKYIGSRPQQGEFIFSNARNSDSAINSMSWQLGWQAKYNLITESEDHYVPSDLADAEKLQRTDVLSSMLPAIFR